MCDIGPFYSIIRSEELCTDYTWGLKYAVMQLSRIWVNYMNQLWRNIVAGQRSMALHNYKPRQILISLDGVNRPSELLSYFTRILKAFILLGENAHGYDSSWELEMGEMAQWF